MEGKKGRKAASPMNKGMAQIFFCILLKGVFPLTCIDPEKTPFTLTVKDKITGEDLLIQGTAFLPPKENREEDLELPKSNVLQFLLEDDSKITMRPSGTEPKIKFYFSVNGKLETPEKYKSVDEKLQKKIDSIIDDLKI